MIFEYLSKMASVLDAVGSPAALQAVEGIDAVLYSVAAANPLLEMYRVLEDAENKLQALFQDAQASGQEVPHLEKNIQVLTSGMSKVRDTFKKAPAFQAALERTFPRIDELPRSDDLSTTLKPGLNDDTITYRGETASSEEELPFHTRPAAYEDTMVRRKANVIEKLTKVADLFDSEGYTEAADIMDSLIKEAVELPNYPSRMETRQELYDAPKHNTETMWEMTKDEVEANRKEHHLETMRPTALSLSTRYSPELPGVPVLRVSDGVYQDFLTKEIYDFNTGWTGRDGRKYPGGSVKNQTPNLTQYSNPSRLFDTRVQANRSRG